MKKGEASDKIPKKKKEDELDEEKLEELKQKKILEYERRKTVHNTICLLTETVTENELKQSLNVLDVNSWDEILEERFITRICGWPLCSHPLNIPIRQQKYKLDKINQKVYESYAVHEKFCSKQCVKNYFHVKPQLNELPLWFTGDRESKEYDFYVSDESAINNLTKNDKGNKDNPEEDKVEFVADKLLCQLHSLQIAENVVDSNSDDDSEDENEIKIKKQEEDKQFLSSIKSFVTAVNQKSDPTSLSENKKQNQPKILLTEKAMEEKLEKLRQKYSNQNKNSKKSIQIIEPTHLKCGEPNL